MQAQNKRVKFPVTGVLVLFSLVGICRSLSVGTELFSSLMFFVEHTVYFGIIVCWSVYVQKSVLSAKARALIRYVTAFMLMYMFIRIVKYQLILDSDFFGRFTWYLYYVPQVFATYIAFIIAYRIGKSEDYVVPKKYIIPLIVGIVLVALFLTNDIHQLAFSFNDGYVNWEKEYDRGLLFYFSTAWIYLWLLSAVIIMYRKCRTLNRGKAWLLLFWLAVGSLYIIATEGINIIPSDFRPYKLPEIHCFIVIAMLESAIRLGLLPSNIAYGDYIGKSSASLQIADHKNNVVYRSENADFLTWEQMEAAKSDEVYVDPDTVLHSASVSGGNIFWFEDMTAVNRMNDELSELSERLSEESDLIRAENDIKEQRAKIDAQNKLYDSINETLSPSLEKISDILANDGDFDKDMAYVCVINCYIKRRANMTLIADSNKKMKINELRLAIGESVKYLSLCGVYGSVNVLGYEDIPSDYALLIFDLWQHCIESTIPELNAVLASVISEKDRFAIKITLDDSDNEPNISALEPKIDALSASYSFLREDDTTYITLTFGKGGDV